MFPMKKTVAALAAAALLAAPSPAFAQDTAISQLSSTSSKGSSKPNYYPDYDKGVTAPEKRPLEGSYTGSAPISLAIALAATLTTVSSASEKSAALPVIRHAAPFRTRTRTPTRMLPAATRSALPTTAPNPPLRPAYASPAEG